MSNIPYIEDSPIEREQSHHEISRREFNNLLENGPEYNPQLADAVRHYHLQVWRPICKDHSLTKTCPVLGISTFGSYALSEVPRGVWDTEFRNKLVGLKEPEWLGLDNRTN